MAGFLFLVLVKMGQDSLPQHTEFAEQLRIDRHRQILFRLGLHTNRPIAAVYS